MGNEEEIIIGFIFKRSGKNQLKESEIYLPLSLELGWFSTADAKKFVADAIQQNLLTRKNGMVTPTFDYTKTSIPVGFYPTIKTVSVKQPLEEEHAIQPKDIIEFICENTGKKYDDIIKEIQTIQNSKSITQQVAALYLAQHYHLDTSAYVALVEKSLFIENGE